MHRESHGERPGIIHFSLNKPLSLHLYVFTSLEALQPHLSEFFVVVLF